MFFLQLLFLEPLDAFMEETAMLPRSLDVYADDLTLQIVMKRGDIIRVSAETLALLADALRDPELPIAVSKAKVMATDMPLATAVARRVQKHGFKPVSVLKVLGMEVAGGRRLRYGVVGKRVRKVTARMPRFRRLRGLRTKEYRQITSPSLGPGMTYGLQVTSAPPHLVKRMAARVREGWAKTPAASSTWVASRLEPSWRQHPDCIAVTGPVRTWARMVAARSVPLEVLQDAWQLQTPRVLLAKEPWKMVVGPAGALALQLRRLGWTASSAHLWRTRRGIALDLTEVSPTWVYTLALRD
jgi:hypothetical protein